MRYIFVACIAMSIVGCQTGERATNSTLEKSSQPIFYDTPAQVGAPMNDACTELANANIADGQYMFQTDASVRGIMKVQILRIIGDSRGVLGGTMAYFGSPSTGSNDYLTGPRTDGVYWYSSSMIHNGRFVHDQIISARKTSSGWEAVLTKFGGSRSVKIGEITLLSAADRLPIAAEIRFTDGFCLARLRFGNQGYVANGAGYIFVPSAAIPSIQY